MHPMYTRGIPYAVMHPMYTPWYTLVVASAQTPLRPWGDGITLRRHLSEHFRPFLHFLDLPSSFCSFGRIRQEGLRNREDFHRYFS